MEAVVDELVSYRFEEKYGIVLLADGRVCYHLWGIEPESLRVRARELAPQASIGSSNSGLVTMLSKYYAGENADPVDWPIDLRGLPRFQRKVYEEARRLRYGRTATYGGLAEAIGSSGAARAVGNALAGNPVPLFVPCHRITAKKGLGGWSGPAGWKERLLALEEGGIRCGPNGAGPQGGEAE